MSKREQGPKDQAVDRIGNWVLRKHIQELDQLKHRVNSGITLDRRGDMRTVTSKDGTTIAFDQTGKGPTIILVNGALGLVRTQHLIHWPASFRSNSRQLIMIAGDELTVAIPNPTLSNARPKISKR
jgi:hypothetical protein